MKKRVYLTPIEVEKELNKAREEIGFTGKIEQAAIKTMIETAKQNGKFGDKILIVLSPVYIHIPTWQRKLYVPRAINIGNSYNKYKWEVPKILYSNGKLFCIDGTHRIYGSFIGGIENVTVEIITDMSEQDAINLFLNQGVDRRGMSPSDIYGAAIEANIPEYVRLKEICAKNSVQVKGDVKTVENPIGILTSISDGTSMAKTNPELLDRILNLIKELQWNGASIYDGKAYSAKVLRVLKKLYAYHEGKENALEAVLLNNCKGAKYFNTNLAEKWQDSLFDFLSLIVEQNINITPINIKEKKVKRIIKAN